MRSSAVIAVLLVAAVCQDAKCTCSLTLCGEQQGSIRRGGNPAEKLKLCCHQLLLLMYHRRRQTKVTEADELLPGPSRCRAEQSSQPFQRKMCFKTLHCLPSSLQPAAQHHPAAHCSVPEPGDVPRRRGQRQQRDADAGGRPGHAGRSHAEPQHTGNHQPCQGPWVLKQPILLCNRACFVPQAPTFPAMLGDSGLSGQTSSGQQVILVSHHSQSDSRAPDNAFSVSGFVSFALEGRRMVRSNCGISVCEQIPDDGHKGGKDGLDAGSRYQCYDCSQVLQNANALRRHCRQAHGKDRCHICPVCDKAFKRATHLKVGPCRQTYWRAGGETSTARLSLKPPPSNLRAQGHQV